MEKQVYILRNQLLWPIFKTNEYSSHDSDFNFIKYISVASLFCGQIFFSRLIDHIFAHILEKSTMNRSVWVQFKQNFIKT